MNATEENQCEGQDTSAAPEAAGLCLRPSVDSDAGLCEHRVQLTNEDRRIRALAHDLPAVWRAPTTTPADRKAMLRLVIEAVAIRPIDVPQRLTQIRVQWKTGAVEPRERQLLFEVGFPVADKPRLPVCLIR